MPLGGEQGDPDDEILQAGGGGGVPTVKMCRAGKGNARQTNLSKGACAAVHLGRDASLHAGVTKHHRGRTCRSEIAIFPEKSLE